MHKETNDPNEIMPDLKHDTMEYSAATDGDDILDDDLGDEEEDEISAEDLAIIDSESEEVQTAALETVEQDRKADDDVNFDVNDVEETEEE